MQVQEIPIERIVEDPEQPRKHQDEESLQGLADSIRRHGVLQPITVTLLANVGMYRIVTGERRWRAAQRAGVRSLPCIVKELEDDDALTEQLIENLQREDLQPLEKARALQQIKNTLGSTNRELGSRLGISERTVGYLLDLLALPEPIAEAVVSSPNRPADGQLTEKHARFIKQLNDLPELQSAVVEKIRENRLNTDHTGALVKALRKNPERAEEILSSPVEHLTGFFRDRLEPAADQYSGQDEGPRSFSRARRIIEMVEVLGEITPSEIAKPELRQIEDALTSLKLAVDGLLRECRLELEEGVRA